MHSKLRDIQEKLDKVKRQPVNSPSVRITFCCFFLSRDSWWPLLFQRTNTSVRSYAMKTPSPAKRGPVIASGVKGGQSSSSKVFNLV